MPDPHELGDGERRGEDEHDLERERRLPEDLWPQDQPVDDEPEQDEDRRQRLPERAAGAAVEASRSGVGMGRRQVGPPSYPPGADGDSTGPLGSPLRLFCLRTTGVLAFPLITTQLRVSWRGYLFCR